MKPKARFIKSILRTAQDCDVDMPWSRQARRAAAPVSKLAPHVARHVARPLARQQLKTA